MSSQNISLYERVGGEKGIVSLVDSFYEKILHDEKLNKFFKDTSVERLKNMQKEFFTVALGGDIEYSGLSLSHAHHGRGIDRSHFQAFVDHLFETLSDFDLTEDERYEIISEINHYVDDITDDSTAPIA